MTEFKVGDVVLVCKFNDHIYKAEVVAICPEVFKVLVENNKIIVRPTFLKWFRRLRGVSLGDVAFLVSKEVAELERMVSA